MTNTDQAEKIYNEAKDAAEAKHRQAIAQAWKASTLADRRAAIKAADDELAADYRAAEDLSRQVPAQPHWGETEWARQNVGLN